MAKPKVFATRPALQISQKTSRAAFNAAVSFGGADTADVFTEVSGRLDKHLRKGDHHG